MLCPKCGFYAEREDSVCPVCGKILLQESAQSRQGVQAIRQGKRAREEAAGKPVRPTAQENQPPRPGGASRSSIRMPVIRDTRQEAYPDEKTGEGMRPEEAPSFERRRHNFYDEDVDATTAVKYAAVHANGSSVPRMVNWVKVSIALFFLFLVLAGGGYFFLKRTNAGQKFLARMGRDATSVALWAVGDEKMNSGDIEGAIECFQKARKKDEAEGVVDVDGLLTLGSALEAADKMDEAAALYEEIYRQTPSRTEAYVNHIRILQNSGTQENLVKAGELMKTAWEKTGDKSFMTQRDDLLPSPPTVNLTAAYYDRKKTLIFTSYQGYDVYFTFDENAKLPEDGQKATPEGVMLDEGIWNMRAVCVNGALVSDELKGTYKIIMPSPMTPRATLAPNTYKTSQRVKLKPGLDDERDTSIVIYYTIDGSIPDSDSPIFDGEPILLPNGWVTLRAYAVNRYRKLSNMLEIKYKIEANPKPKSAFAAEDTIDRLKMFSTTQAEFFATYGEGKPAGSVRQEGFETECRRFDYSWGYAVMNLAKKNWVLAEVSFHSPGVMNGPRGTQVGDTDKYVIDKFRDMQQVESKSGNRGLYATDNGSSGKIWMQEDGSIIRYRYPVDSHWVQLEYKVSKSGTVTNIDMKYIP